MKQLCVVTIFLTIFLLIEASNVVSKRTFFPNTQFSNGDEDNKHGKIDRVVGGKPAPLKEFSYQVAVLIHINSQIMQCGGAIISPTKIVTAGHCVTSTEGQMIEPKNFVVKAGSVYITSEHMKKFLVESITTYPSYNKDNYNNDIAIITLEKPIKFNENISSIPLSMETPKDNTSCVVSGWGYTDPQVHVTSPVLLYTPVSIINHERCNTAYRKINSIINSMICAQRLDEIGDSCQGDSGGPMACDQKLVGIVSWGYDCGKPKYPGVYTNIAAYSEWLQAVAPTKNSKSNSTFHNKSLYLLILLIVYNVIQFN